MEYKEKQNFTCNLEKKKVCVFGLDGSGKTHILKTLINKNNYTVLVWTYQKHDYTQEGDNYLLYNFSNNKDFSDFCVFARELAENGFIDGVIIDDFDFLFDGNVNIPESFNYIITQLRHSGLFCCVTSKRPNDIKTKFVETSHIIISYQITGDNSRKKFNNIYSSMGDKITGIKTTNKDIPPLKYEMNSPDNEFIFYEIGHAPIIYK
jgi:GTPase SAR1 family protein